MDAKTSEIFANLSKLKWASESLTLVQLIESLEMPQLVKVVKSNISEAREGDFLLLQSVYDRYLVLGSTSNHSYLIPDWYRAHCKIRSSNPALQKQFWNFQGATEINRFDLPRDINFLTETPIYMFINKNNNKTEWKKVVLKRNTRMTVKKMQSFMVDGNKQGTCFILVDRKGLKFMLPTDFNIKFSVDIKQDEYTGSYLDNKGVFSLPEVITRYEFPVDVEFVASNEPGSIPANKLPPSAVKFQALAIAKSIVGGVFDLNTRKLRPMELSPAAQIKVAIPRCLQQGLLNPNSNLSREEEKDYDIYNKSRESALAICHKQCELFKYDMRQATSEEKDGMLRIYEMGFKYRRDAQQNLKENYLLDLSSREAVNPDAKIPFIALKSIFLRPNIDEGDPYDDVTQEADEKSSTEIQHDMSVLNQMPDRLVTDSMTDLEPTPVNSYSKSSSRSKN